MRRSHCLPREMAVPKLLLPGPCLSCWFCRIHPTRNWRPETAVLTWTVLPMFRLHPALRVRDLQADTTYEPRGRDRKRDRTPAHGGRSPSRRRQRDAMDQAGPLLRRCRGRARFGVQCVRESVRTVVASRIYMGPGRPPAHHHRTPCGWSVLRARSGRLSIRLGTCAHLASAASLEIGVAHQSPARATT